MSGIHADNRAALGLAASISLAGPIAAAAARSQTPQDRELDQDHPEPWNPVRQSACALASAFFGEIRGAKLTIFLFMDVFCPLPYFEGLLNRMVIKAIAASSFIRYVNKNHEAWERRMSPLCN